MNFDAEDALISRIIDREADLTDWDALELWATDDPTVWTRLAHGLRTECALQRALGDSRAVPPLPKEHRRLRLHRLAAAAGVAALLIGAFWAGRRSVPEAPSRHPAPLAQTGPASEMPAPEERLADSEVLQRLPDVVIRHRPSENGVELLLLRRSIERRRVDGVYPVGRDELGRLAAAPAAIPRRDGPSSF